MKKLMIVGAGEEQRIAIREAQTMGYRVFAIDGDKNAPGFEDADEYAVISTYDYESAFKAACRAKIDGVMTVAADVPYTVAYVAKLMGLRGIDLRTAWILTDKLRMKAYMGEVLTPPNAEVFSENDVGKFVYTYSDSVIKPVDSRGARGVQRVFVGMDYKRLILEAKKHSPTGRVMIERYIEGHQLSVEGFMLAGMIMLPAIFDRNYEYLNRFHPFIVENGGEMPSEHDEKEIYEAMQRAANMVGLRTGPVKGDLVIDKKGNIWVIEIAGRMSGGWFGTVAAEYSTGVHFVRNNIKWAMEGNAEWENWEPTDKFGAAIRFAFPEPGRVVSVTGLNKVQEDKDCLYARCFVKTGDKINPIENHPGRPAVVVAKGKNRDDAKKNAERLIARIRIKTDGKN